MDERFAVYAGRREESSIEVYDSVAYFVVVCDDKAYFFQMSLLRTSKDVAQPMQWSVVL